MPTDTTPAAAQPPLNEIARAVVALPEDATFYNDTRFVAIAWDDPGDAGAPRPTILGAEHGGLPYVASYQLIDLLCGDRAMRAVDGTLRLRHRMVTPEAYLGMWRAALLVPFTPDELASRLGWTIRVTLGAALAAARQARSHWSTSPFESFAAFEATYGPRFVQVPTASGAPGFELTLDLREPTAARDAFYGRDLVTDREDAEGQVRTALAAIGTAGRALPPPGAQDPLSERRAP